jgi:hypothetical protein
MAILSKTELDVQVRDWIKKNAKENRRLEFKQRIELSTIGAKTESIRDVIALANSEGEAPRDDGHLVIRFDMEGTREWPELEVLLGKLLGILPNFIRNEDKKTGCNQLVFNHVACGVRRKEENDAPGHDGNVQGSDGVRNTE